MRIILRAVVCAMLAIAPAAYAQVSDLTISKAGPSTAPANTDVTYTIDVTNLGPNASGTVTMTDTISGGWSFQGVTPPAGFSCVTPGAGATSGVVTCTAASMAASATSSFAITFHIPSGTAAGTVFSNTADVASPTDTNTNNNSSTVQTTVVDVADLTVLKTGPATTDVDVDVSYNIAVTNLGPSDSGPLTLNDPVAGGWSFVSVTPPGGFSCTDPGAGATSGTVICNGSNLAAGATVNFTIVFHIPSNAAPNTTFTNVATVSAPTDPDGENNSSAASTTVNPPPMGDVAITKNGPVSAPPDTDVTYTITVTNFGPSTAQNVVWTDNTPNSVPAGSPMTFVSLNQNSGPSVTCSTGATIRCPDVGGMTLAAGASATWMLVLHIPSGTPSGRTYTNVANVTSDNDPSSENNSSSTTVIVETADVGVTKSAPATAVAGGPTFDYVITLSNSGPDAASDATFTDVLPAGILFQSLTQDTGPTANCSTPTTGTNGTVSCSIPVLPNGQSVQFTITVQATTSIANGTVVTNTATASTASADTNANNNSSSASTTITSLADLSIVKSGPATVTAGTDVPYTIAVANAGPSPATNATWTDTLPAGSIFGIVTQNTGPAFTCGNVGLTVTCSIATFNAGASATFTIHMLAPPAAPSGSTLSNTASITASSPADPDMTNNSSTTSATVNTQADMSIDKTGPSAASANSNLTYQIVLQNHGTSQAVNISWTDVLPPNTTFVSIVGPGPAPFNFTCTGGATVTCSGGIMPPTALTFFSLTVHVSAAAPNGSVISNTATVTSTTPDANPTNNSSTAATTVSAIADLAVTKNGPASTPSNTTVVYTVTVTNNGPADAANVTLTDTLPTGTTFVSINQTSGPVFSCSGTGPVTCTIATFANGATASFQLTLNVPPSVNSGTTLTNTATISATTPDSNPNNNTATASTGVGVSIPAMSPLMLALLALMVSALALAALRR